MSHSASSVGSRIPPSWMCPTPQEVSMRKSIILIIVLGICGILSGEGWALPISLGHHSARDIAGACASVGGNFFQIAGSYGCINTCGNGQLCSVECSRNGQCVGDCPACGGPDQPVVRGGPNVTRLLNNLRTARAGGPAYGYGPGPYPNAAIVNPVTGRWCRTESTGYQFCWTP